MTQVISQQSGVHMDTPMSVQNLLNHMGVSNCLLKSTYLYTNIYK